MPPRTRRQLRTNAKPLGLKQGFLAEYFLAVEVSQDSAKALIYAEALKRDFGIDPRRLYNNGRSMRMDVKQLNLTDEEKAQVEKLQADGLDINLAVIAVRSGIDSAAEVLKGLQTPQNQQQQQGQQQRTKEDEGTINTLKELYEDAKKNGRPDMVSYKNRLFREFGVHVN